MKRKLVNKKVVNSIGVGILAFITATTPVMSVAAEEGDTAGTNSTTTDSGDTTENSAANEATDAVNKAQAAVDKATEEIPEEKTDGQKQIAGSLENAKEAMKDMPGAVEELDELNKAAAGSKAELNGAVTDDENGTMGTMAENVAGGMESAEAAAKSTGQNAEEAEGLAGAAENAQGVTYENSEAAAAAKAQAQADADAAEAALAEAEAADAAAQEKVDIAKTSLDLITEQKEKADAAYAQAQADVAAAQAKLAEITGNPDNQAAIDAAKAALDAAQAELERAQAEQSDTAAALAHWEEEVTRAQAKAAEAAAELAEKEKERDEAQAKLNGLEAELAGKNTEKSELDGQKTGLQEAADEAGENYTKAEGELKTASTNAETAAKTATEAAEAAETAEADAKTAAEAAETAETDAKTAAEAAETAEADAKTAAEAAEKAEADSLTAAKAAEKAEAVAKAYENAQTAQGIANDKLDKYNDAWPHEKKAARDEYYIAADEAVNARIRCMLAEEGITDVTIGEWHKEDGRANKDYYVKVTYEKDGVQCQEYYDYTDEDMADPVIVKKTPIYESAGDYHGFTFPLEVSVENGEAKYKLDGEEVNYEGDNVSVTLPVEIKTYTYGALNNKHTLVAATIDGETKYYDEDGNVAKVTHTAGSWFVNGVVRRNFELKSTETTKETISFANTNTFNGKGTPVPGGLKKDDVTSEVVEAKTKAAAEAKVDAETKAKEAETAKTTAEAKAQDAETAKQDADKKAQDAETAKQDAEKKAQDAETAKENADQKAQDAEDANDLLEVARTAMNEAAKKKGEADDALKALNEQIEGLADAISKLNEAIEIADGDLKGKEDAVTDATKKNNAANNLVTTNTNVRDVAKTNADAAVAKAAKAGKISGSVQTAYEKVVAAIEALQKLTAEADVDAEEYNKVVAAYEKAVSDYEDALTAKGVSASNVARVSAAAQRARAAADGVFAYQSPAASTGGGTTGGGTTTTETSEDSDLPTIELIEEDIPLAGGAGTTAVAGVQRGSSAGGSGTGSIETVKAGGNGTSGGAGIELEDEEVPLAGLDLEEEDGKGKAETGVVLEDEETPLAAPIEEQSRMSWWWLILIAVLGVTGEEMYRRHRKKAAEEKELNS